MRIQGKLFLGFLVLLGVVLGVLRLKAGKVLEQAELDQAYYQQKVLPKVERINLAGFHFSYMSAAIEKAIAEKSVERIREAAAIEAEIARLARGDSNQPDPIVDAVTAYRKTAEDVVERQVSGAAVDLGREIPRVNRARSKAAKVLTEVRKVIVEGEQDWRERSMRRVESFGGLVLLLAAAGVGLGAALSLALATWVTGPLREMQDAVEKMTGSSDVDHVVPVRSRDEIGMFAQAFNTFLRGLKAQRLDTKLLQKHAELSREKFAFQSNLSHELKTPLTTMRGVVDFLQKDLAGKLTRSQERFFNIMDQELERLTRLVYNLLDFQRIESTARGPVDGAFTAVDVRMAIGPALDKVKSALKAAPDIVFRKAVPDFELWVEIDWNQIVAVLSNLLDNAIKFMGGKGEFGVEMTRLEDEVKITVWDTGIGIALDHQSRVFDRFYQVDASMTRKYGGTGIGLFVVKNIVEANMGSVRVQSTEGKGSRFTIRFPMAKHPGGSAPVS